MVLDWLVDEVPICPLCQHLIAMAFFSKSHGWHGKWCHTVADFLNCTRHWFVCFDSTSDFQIAQRQHQYQHHHASLTHQLSQFRCRLSSAIDFCATFRTTPTTADQKAAVIITAVTFFSSGPDCPFQRLNLAEVSRFRLSVCFHDCVPDAAFEAAHCCTVQFVHEQKSSNCHRKCKPYRVLHHTCRTRNMLPGGKIVRAKSSRNMPCRKILEATTLTAGRTSETWPLYNQSNSGYLGF